MSYVGSSVVAVALPAASSFGNNFFFHVEATGSGLPTFTPASGTINGASSFTPPQNSFGTIYSPDNTNWTADFAVKVPRVTVFASLPACDSANEGLTAPVSDSTTTTWGAAIAGGGSSHVLAYCDGANWTVAAK